MNWWIGNIEGRFRSLHDNDQDKKYFSSYTLNVESNDQRAGFTPGKWLAGEPKKKNGKHQYGLDALGRVLVERKYTSIREQMYETFYEVDIGNVEIDNSLFEPYLRIMIFYPLDMMLFKYDDRIQPL